MYDLESLAKFGFAASVVLSAFSQYRQIFEATLDAGVVDIIFFASVLVE